MWRALIKIAVLSAGTLDAQKPVEVAPQCSAELIDSLELPCTSEAPCPLFVELSSAEAAGPRLIVTGNVHTGSATVQSILLISDDDGRTWTEAHTRMPGAVLDQIVFHDFALGWIAGHRMAGNIPRDPFVLITNDGGKTWRRKTVSSEANRTGVIEHIRFDGKSAGRLAVDRVRAAEDGLRYEIWETLTAGESWNIKQVDSRPLSFESVKRDKSLQFVPAKDGQVVRLQRGGSAPSTVATFRIKAGECKPPAPVDREPEADAKPQPE